jgi:hypothetical protein
VVASKLQDCVVGSLSGENVAQQRDLVPKAFEQIAQVFGDVVVKQKLHSGARAICAATSKSISPL